MKIEREGRYRTRCGEVVEINKITDGFAYSKNPPNGCATDWWTLDGNFHACGGIHNLIEGPLDTPLKGFVRIVGDEASVMDQVTPYGLRDATVIDLSRVPEDAIVRPAPKKISGWVNVFIDNENQGEFVSTGLYASRRDADDNQECEQTDHPRIACIKVECVEGDGL